jgi:hypothetical protein
MPGYNPGGASSAAGESNSTGNYSGDSQQYNAQNAAVEANAARQEAARQTEIRDAQIMATEEANRAFRQTTKPISMAQELQERGSLSTGLNHLKGVLPGYDVQANNYAYPGLAGPIAAPNTEDFSFGRAIADVAGFATGLPLGTGYDMVSGLIEGDGTKNSTTTASNSGTTLSSNSNPSGMNKGGGGGLLTPEQLVNQQVASAAPQSPQPQSIFGHNGLVYDNPDPSYKYGGVVSAQGDNQMANDSVQRMIDIATDPAYNTMDYSMANTGVPGQPVMNPSYAEGGVVSQAGPQPQQAGLTPQGSQQGAPAPQQVQQEMQRMMQENPQQVQQIRQAMEIAIQEEGITPQEMNMITQLFTSAMQNPQLWPQLRQHAIKVGMADEEDLPQEYDQGLIMATLMALQSMNAPGAQGEAPVPQSQGQPPQATMRTGGEVPKSNNADGSVAINAHKGEYVIPEHVVLKKGTDFFDKMVGKDEKANV